MEGCGDGALSDAAAQLVANVNATVDAMEDADREARQRDIDNRFQPRLIIVNGAEVESVGIELRVSQGSEWREKFIFYNDNDAWKLWKIEKGTYITVNA